ncbi:hypothetical protein SteCoe_9244 [Stentor coeruleus]|uniref:Uncharacterized protein n=1 Tax=Stentor coeruleus TaxID=5963 RepID=A0A1R2CIE7_9CILI|nr:hypothetical protein SteCoe_9244 [Stentor coeruleus]
MSLKSQCRKFALFTLRHIINTSLILSFSKWKNFRKNRLTITNHSRIPKHLSLNLSPTVAKNINKITETRIQRPKSVKSESQCESPIDFGSRLHQKAQEIEQKKENIRKSLEPEYSFTPKISKNTPKWLNSRLKKGKDVKKEKDVKNEEVAVVSGNCVLGVSSYTPNLKGLLEKKIFAQGNKANINRNSAKIMPQRKISCVPGFSDDPPKENYGFFF